MRCQLEILEATEDCFRWYLLWPASNTRETLIATGFAGYFLPYPLFGLRGTKNCLDGLVFRPEIARVARLSRVLQSLQLDF